MKSYKKEFLLYYFTPLIIISIITRIHYLFRKAGNLDFPNLGGDPCNHYNIAYNVSKGIGPYTDYIIHYWFYHPAIPAMSDVYMPGFHLFLGLFMFIFGDTYFVARLFNFFLSLFTIFLAYKIGKKIHSRYVGIISSSVLAFNIFHIENSTVVMSPIFTLMIMQLSIFFILISGSNKKLLAISGCVTGYSFLTINASLGIFFVGFFIILYSFYKTRDKNNLLNLFIYIFSFIIILTPWGIITYNYFGEIFYSNLKYYPFTNNFSEMMHSTSPPDIMKFFEQNSILLIIKKYIIYSYKDILRLSLYLTPTPIFFTSWLSIPLIIYSIIKFKNKIIYLNFILLFPGFFYFLSIIIGSSALGGQLWPRHFIPLLCFFSPLYSIAIYNLLYVIINKYQKFLFTIATSYKAILYPAVLLLFVGFGGACIVANEIKESFWERPSEKYFIFGKWINENTNSDDVIMYALTPSDAWCATKRSIVGDPVFAYEHEVNKAKKQMLKYNVKYIWFDFSNDIYKRSHYREKLEKKEELYDGVNLKLIYTDIEKNHFFYEIIY